MSINARHDTVTCWACAIDIPREDAIIVYRDQQGGLHTQHDPRGLWLAEYLCADCAESFTLG